MSSPIDISRFARTLQRIREKKNPVVVQQKGNTMLALLAAVTAASAPGNLELQQPYTPLDPFDSIKEVNGMAAYLIMLSLNESLIHGQESSPDLNFHVGLAGVVAYMQSFGVLPTEGAIDLGENNWTKNPCIYIHGKVLSVFTIAKWISSRRRDFLNGRLSAERNASISAAMGTGTWLYMLGEKRVEKLDFDKTTNLMAFTSDLISLGHEIRLTVSKVGTKDLGKFPSAFLFGKVYTIDTLYSLLSNIRGGGRYINPKQQLDAIFEGVAWQGLREQDDDKKRDTSAMLFETKVVAANSLLLTDGKFLKREERLNTYPSIYSLGRVVSDKEIGVSFANWSKQGDNMATTGIQNYRKNILLALGKKFQD